MPPPPRKLLDQVRDRMRLKHSSLRTEEAFVQCITRSSLFHNKRHPLEMGAPEIEAFLTHLAVADKVASSWPCPRREQPDRPVTYQGEGHDRKALELFERLRTLYAGTAGGDQFRLDHEPGEA